MITRIYTKLHIRLNEDRGASAVEYGLLVAGIAAVIIVAVFLLGKNVNNSFGTINSEIVKK